ncbi:hypothetical protein K440DRAFT_664119 [Wilcoxina mikolae CBS 423.85]|nr:hypothetical protein K440DRAFT_664119 [Wilcoxina mikolae CBS 423.85]
MSSSSSPQFAQVLHSITQTKFNELSKKRAVFIPHLSAVRSIQSDDTMPLLKKAWKIIEKNIDTNPTDPAQRPVGEESTIEQYVQLIKLAENDPSISNRVVESWTKVLADGFEREDQMQVFGGLFANLLQEWLVKGEEKSEPSLDIGDMEKKSEAVTMEGNFEKVGRKEMHEQQARSEDLVFSPNDTDATEIEKYLDQLFRDTPEDAGAKSLDTMRDDIERQANHYTTVNREKLRKPSCNYSREICCRMKYKRLLKNFWKTKLFLKSSPTLSRYTSRPLIRGPGRKVFLQCLGTFWSRTLYAEFAQFFDSPSWKPTIVELSQRESVRREYFLKDKPSRFDSPNNAPRYPVSINASRHILQHDQYFMSQLREATNIQSPDTYGDNGRDESYKTPSGPGLKQSLLHLISNGLDQRWLQFFKTFSEAPLKFPQDGSHADVRVRNRGVPISHALSTALGEAMLFCMDYAVNKIAMAPFCTAFTTIYGSGTRILSNRADICSPASPEATQAGLCQGRLHMRWSVPDRPANLWVGLRVDWPLRNTVIENRFGASNIPAGWFFWPTRLGGLEVNNPFINLNATRNGGNLPDDPNMYFRKLIEKEDIERYNQKKKAWESSRALNDIMSHHIDLEEDFMPFEGYVLGRESRDSLCGEKYAKLIEGKAEMSHPTAYPSPSLEMIQSLDALGARYNDTELIDCHWKWIMAVWGQ